MLISSLALVLVSMGAAPVHAWEFNGVSTEGWEPNTFLANVELKQGRIHADAIDWDPFFTCSGLDIQATPWQFVVLRISADRAGTGELFWSGETTGEHGGFSAQKSTSFHLQGDKRTHDVVLFPFWQSEGVIRQLRLDLYDSAHYTIDSIQILDWAQGTTPATDTYSWELGVDPEAWKVAPSGNERMSPPLKLDVTGKGWVSVRMQCQFDGVATLLWAAPGQRGLQMADFDVRGGRISRSYNIEMSGRSGWDGEICAIGVRLPALGGPLLEGVAIAAEPSGPAELMIDYFGPEDALSRASRPCRVLAQITNVGGADSEAGVARLVLSPDLRFVQDKADRPLPILAHGETETLRWTVTSTVPGEHRILLNTGGPNVSESKITLSRNLLLAKEEYVPTPNPVATTAEICAFYFPGWESNAKWDCIRRVAPIRKPALGYYDESNPECVDWQIKWAVENGISCFLVDWYWNQGRQHLTHWFDAYRKARYRDFLKVSIMWANHNEPGSHSADDMRAVAKEWIDRYFNLPSYYKINGKPAVFIWAPSNIRQDLGGTAAVKAVYDECQQMARAAGHDGIEFVAMGYDFSPTSIQALGEEGYTGVTTYHEWGIATDSAMANKRMNYRTVAEESPKAWEHKNEQSAPLTYYPLVDTGWDSRPWHGDKAFVIEGRSAPLFEEILNSAAAFTENHKGGIVILGPLNEWGEGSYIEPCLEFGFDMYEAIRRTFGRGNPRRWPENATPADVGLGPYDYPERVPVSSWAFDGPETGWRLYMNLGDESYGDGKLRVRALGSDPALMADTGGIKARDFSKAVITMRLTAPEPPAEGAVPADTAGQLFWATSGETVSEESSVHFPIVADGQMRTYELDLTANPRWRGTITTLRFDPCSMPGGEVELDEVHLKR